MAGATQQGRRGDALLSAGEEGARTEGGREDSSGGPRLSAAPRGCWRRSARGDDAATLLDDGGAGGDAVAPRPGESPRSPAEGR